MYQTMPDKYRVIKIRKETELKFYKMLAAPDLRYGCEIQEALRSNTVLRNEIHQTATKLYEIDRIRNQDTWDVFRIWMAD